MAIAETPQQNKELIVRKSKKFKHLAKADEELKTKLRTVLDDESKSYDDILKYVNNEIKESTRTVSFNYVVKCFKEDGAYALSRAVEAIHGFTTQSNEKTMSGSNPPSMIDVRFADGTRKKVPFGQISLPSLGKDAFIDMKYDIGTRSMVLTGQCEKRFVRLMDEIIEETKNLVENDSIYRGQAIKINDENQSPEFINLDGINKQMLFLTRSAQRSTKSIEARIERSEACVLKGVDLRFGVLLEGPYGTGKTLYAFKLAYKAIRNGWSFVYCPKPEKALYVMEVANMLSKNGKGVVVFLEDVDHILGERNNMTNQISVLMDGGETKSNNVITIMTTNHVENIDPTFLRGKRIGTIVTLEHPDAATAKQMIEAYLVDENRKSILVDDCTEAAQEMENLKIVPAFIAEILDRVKSHLVYSEERTVSNADIMDSIKDYKRQIDIAALRTSKVSKSEEFVQALRDVLRPDPQPVTESTVEDIFSRAGIKVLPKKA